MTEPAKSPSEHPSARGELAARASRWAPLLVGLVLAAPVALAPYPPMLDLPLHEAIVGILRHGHDAAMFPQGLYVRNFGHPNQLFHLVAWALSRALPTTLSVRVVVAASVVAIAAAGARLADHLGASRWAAVVVAPVALGYLFSLGLVANLLGLALLLAVLPSLDRFIAAPTLVQAGVSIVAVVGLYLAHEMMLFIYLGAILLFTLVAEIDARRSALRLAPLAFGVALVLWQQRLQSPLMTAAVRGVPTEWSPIARKIIEIPVCLFVPLAYVESLALFCIAALAIGLLGASGRAPGSTREATFRVWVRAHRFELLASTCLAGYFLAPVSIHGANLVHHRFLAPAYAIGVLAVSGRGRGAASTAPRLVPLLASVLPVGLLLVWWPAFVDSSRDHADVIRLSQKIAVGSAMATLEVGDRPSEASAPKQPMALAALGERGGRTLFSFASSPISPVMITPAYQWNEPIDRILVRGSSWCPSYDDRHFRYVLLYAPSAELQLVASRAMEPEARYVGRAGVWVLYESTLDVVPLLSPDGPGPGAVCEGGDLNARMNRVRSIFRETAVRGGTLPALPPE